MCLVKNQKKGLILGIVSISIVVLAGIGFYIWLLASATEPTVFKVGDYVLYNPVLGTKCEKESDDCLMFNVTSINEDNINIMLSRNLLYNQYWDYKGSNALDSLASATSSWKQKARILSGQEVADILGFTDWTDSSSSVDKSAVDYIWLIQNLQATGDKRDKSNLGYWTSTPNFEHTQCMYDVSYEDLNNNVSLATYGIGFDSCSYNDNNGVRPVITVSKSDVKLLDYVVHMDDVSSDFKNYEYKSSSDNKSISLYGYNLAYNKVLLSTYDCSDTCYTYDVQDASSKIAQKKLLIRDGKKVLLYNFETKTSSEKYDNISQIKNGESVGTSSTINSDILIVESQDKYGLIDFDGKTITDIIYDSIGERGASSGFSSAYNYGADKDAKTAPAVKNGISGYINYETGLFTTN